MSLSTLPVLLLPVLLLLLLLLLLLVAVLLLLALLLLWLLWLLAVVLPDEPVAVAEFSIPFSVLSSMGL